MSSNTTSKTQRATLRSMKDQISKRQSTEHLSLLGWVNAFLHKRGLSAENLSSDFADGVLLINLIEVAAAGDGGIGGSGRYHTQPKQEIQRIDNVSRVQAFLKRGSAVDRNIDTIAIVRGNERAVISVLWSLVEALTLKAIGITEKQGKGATGLKAGVLAWLTKSLEPPPTDFYDSFQDGRLLCALVNLIIPDSIKPKKVPSKPKKALELATKTAEKKLGIQAADLVAILLGTEVKTSRSKWGFRKTLKKKDLQASIEDAAKEAASSKRADNEQAVCDYVCMLLSGWHGLQGAAKRSAEEAKEMADLQKVIDQARKDAEEAQKTKGKKKKVSLKKAHKRVSSKVGQEAKKMSPKVAVQKSKAATSADMKSAAKKTKGSSDVAALKSEIEALQSQLEAKEAALVGMRDELDVAEVSVESAEANAEMWQTRFLALDKSKSVQEMRLRTEYDALLYTSHRDYELLLEQVKEKNRRDAQAQAAAGGRAGRGTSGGSYAAAGSHGASGSVRKSLLLSRKDQVMLERQEAMSDNDLIANMRMTEGFLMKRSPNAWIGSSKFAQLYFNLKGTVLECAGVKDGRSKGSFNLVNYTYGEQIFEENSSEELTFRFCPRDANGRPDPASGDVLDIKSTEEDSDIMHRNIHRWAHEINVRIAIAHYMRTHKENYGKAWGCRELLLFLTDDEASILQVRDKLMGLREPLSIISPAFYGHSRLRHIFLSAVNLDDRGVEVIARVLKENDYCKRLELPNNNITEIGGGHLRDALLDNQSLERLSLDNNQLRDEGLVRLSSALPYHVKMWEVSLCGNAIGDDGIEALAKNLEVSKKKNKKAHHFPVVKLNYNLIGDVGAKSLAAVCNMNATVKEIHLSHNLVGDEGCTALASAAAMPGSGLCGLFLASNQLTSNGVKALSAALSKIEREFTVDISENLLVSYEGVAAMVMNTGLKFSYSLLKLTKQDKTRARAHSKLIDEKKK